MKGSIYNKRRFDGLSSTEWISLLYCSKSAFWLGHENRDKKCDTFRDKRLLQKVVTGCVTGHDVSLALQKEKGSCTLNESDFAAAIEKGSLMTMEQAIAYTLEFQRATPWLEPFQANS